MSTLWIVLFGIIAIFLAYTLLAPTLANLPQFVRRVPVDCPYLKVQGDVKLRALPASFASAYGWRFLRVKSCSLLGRRAKCDQACLDEANI